MKTNKTKEEEIIDNIDRAINELVYEKTQIIKAYNYYHGKRDPEQFRHLEENYGIGTPTSIEFVPLVRKHVDVLIGEYLSTPVLPRITCKDEETLSNIYRDKQLTIHKAITEELKTHLTNTVYNSIEAITNPQQQSQQPQQPKQDSQILKMLDDLHDSIERNFISEYEIAAQNIVDWAMQSRAIDFSNQRKILLTDLLISGTSYYKCTATPNNTSIQLKVLNPINTFIDRNPESVYLKDSARAVVREYLTKDQILAKYGDYLKKDDLETLDTLQDYSVDGSSTTYLRSYDSITGNTMSDGILGGFEVTPLLPFERNTSKYFRVFPCYEVEWLKTEKENGKFVTNRYEGVRIGTNIYIPKGKAEHVFRSIDDPTKCTLSVNGIFYSDRNGDPFSLLLKTANLQDKYDIINFMRDNVISESGTAGDFIDLAHLPKVLGNDLTERLMKFKAYGKAGMKLYDSSQEGQMINTSFNGYDDTLKLNTIQAFDLAIQRIEETCSMITGVFREKLGGIEQKDAVTNVQVGVKQSTYITKQYYQNMDLMTREMLLDILNLSKVVFKNGMTGTLILGDKLNKIFTALPEYFTITDHDIHISDSSEVIKEQETLKQLGMQFVQSGLVEADIILDIMSSKSLTKTTEDVKISMRKKKEENNQLQQMQQQLQQMDQQLKQTTSEAQKLQQKIQQLNEEKLRLDQEKLKFEKELEWFKAKDVSAFNQQKLEFEKKRVDLEGLQLLDNNKNNDEIKNE